MQEINATNVTGASNKSTEERADASWKFVEADYELLE